MTDSSSEESIAADCEASPQIKKNVDTSQPEQISNGSNSQDEADLVVRTNPNKQNEHELVVDTIDPLNHNNPSDSTSYLSTTITDSNCSTSDTSISFNTPALPSDSALVPNPPSEIINEIETGN